MIRAFFQKIVLLLKKERTQHDPLRVAAFVVYTALFIICIAIPALRNLTVIFLSGWVAVNLPPLIVVMYWLTIVCLSPRSRHVWRPGGFVLDLSDAKRGPWSDPDDHDDNA